MTVSLFAQNRGLRALFAALVVAGCAEVAAVRTYAGLPVSLDVDVSPTGVGNWLNEALIEASSYANEINTYTTMITSLAQLRRINVVWPELAHALASVGDLMGSLKRARSLDGNNHWSQNGQNQNWLTLDGRPLSSYLSGGVNGSALSPYAMVLGGADFNLAGMDASISAAYSSVGGNPFQLRANGSLNTSLGSLNGHLVMGGTPSSYTPGYGAQSFQDIAHMSSVISAYRHQREVEHSADVVVSAQQRRIQAEKMLKDAATQDQAAGGSSPEAQLHLGNSFLAMQLAVQQDSAEMEAERRLAEDADRQEQGHVSNASADLSVSVALSGL